MYLAKVLNIDVAWWTGLDSQMDGELNLILHFRPPVCHSLGLMATLMRLSCIDSLMDWPMD